MAPAIKPVLIKEVKLARALFKRHRWNVGTFRAHVLKLDRAGARKGERAHGVTLIKAVIVKPSISITGVGLNHGQLDLVSKGLREPFSAPLAQPNNASQKRSRQFIDAVSLVNVQTLAEVGRVRREHEKALAHVHTREPPTHLVSEPVVVTQHVCQFVVITPARRQPPKGTPLTVTQLTLRDNGWRRWRWRSNGTV